MARMHDSRDVEATDEDHHFEFMFDDVLSQVNVSELGKQIALFAGARG